MKKSLTDATRQQRAERNSSDAKDRATAAATGDRSEEPRKRLNAHVPESLHRRFKRQAERDGHTLTYVLTQFAEHYADTGELPE